MWSSRPYSAIDPISYIMTGGNLESGNARLINAIGEIGFMIYADPLTKVNKVVKAKNAILKSEAYQKGRASAEDLKKLTVLESQIAASADDTVKALEDLGLVERAVNAGVPVADSELLKFQKTYNDAVAKKVRLDAESQALKQGLDYDAIEKFLNGASARPILNEIAEMDDYFDIWQLSRRNGRGGFTIEQAKALAGAKSRDEVLEVLAPYIAGGTVAQNILETGTVTSRALSGIVKGKVARPAQFIAGRAASGIKKLPYAEKLYNGISKNYTTYIPRSGTLVHY